MGTRAVVTVKGEEGQFNVYKHYDGYPSGEAGMFALLSKTVREYVWPLPRFEADEFAAGFVAAAKHNYSDLGWSRGGVRLLLTGNWEDVAPGDIEYVYEVTKAGVECFSVDANYDWKRDTNKWSYEPVAFYTLGQLASINFKHE